MRKKINNNYNVDQKELKGGGEELNDYRVFFVRVLLKAMAM